jgi:hypothetical protein
MLTMLAGLLPTTAVAKGMCHRLHACDTYTHIVVQQCHVSHSNVHYGVTVCMRNHQQLLQQVCCTQPDFFYQAYSKLTSSSTVYGIHNATAVHYSTV